MHRVSLGKKTGGWRRVKCNPDWDKSKYFLKSSIESSTWYDGTSKLHTYELVPMIAPASLK